MKKNKDEYTVAEAKKSLLVQDGMVHTFFNLPFGIIGARWPVKDVHKEIDKAYRLMKTGPEAMKMKHGLAIQPRKECYQKDILFVETKPEKEKKK